MASATITDVDELRRQMAQIRRELHEDMQGVVAGAEAAFDWQYYVRLYPWAALAGAAAVGFLVVPRRRRSASEVAAATVEHVKETIAEAAPRARGKAQKPETKAEAKAKGGLWGALFGMVVPVVVRAAQSYASSYVENLLAQQNLFGPPPGGPGAGPVPGQGPAAGGMPPGAVWPPPSGWPGKPKPA